MMEFLGNTDGIHRIFKTARWACEPIILSIEEFEGRTEVQLNRW